MRIKARRSFSLAGALIAVTLSSIVLTSCGLGGQEKRDPVLRVGDIRVGMNTGRLERKLGRGTPAQWLDDRGQHVSVLLYRNGPAVLAAVVDAGQVAGVELYQRMPSGADVHNEFTLPHSAQPFATTAAFAHYLWLDAPVFSDSFPNTPAGWNVPTDFTVAQVGKSFYIVREGHAASKTMSKAYGWIVRVR